MFLNLPVREPGGTVTVAVIAGPGPGGRRLLQGTVIGTGPVVTAASGVTSFAQVLVRCRIPACSVMSHVLLARHCLGKFQRRKFQRRLSLHDADACWALAHSHRAGLSMRWSMASCVTAAESAVRLCARSTGPPLAAGTTAVLQVLFGGNTDFLPSSLPFPGYSVVITVREPTIQPPTRNHSHCFRSMVPATAYVGAVNVAAATAGVQGVLVHMADLSCRSKGHSVVGARGTLSATGALWGHSRRSPHPGQQRSDSLMTIVGVLPMQASGTSPTYSSTTPPPSSLAPPTSYATATTVSVSPAAAFVGAPITISGAVTSTAGHPSGSVVVRAS